MRKLLVAPHSSLLAPAASLRLDYLRAATSVPFNTTATVCSSGLSSVSRVTARYVHSLCGSLISQSSSSASTSASASTATSWRSGACRGYHSVRHDGLLRWSSWHQPRRHLSASSRASFAPCHSRASDVGSPPPVLPPSQPSQQPSPSPPTTIQASPTPSSAATPTRSTTPSPPPYVDASGRFDASALPKLPFRFDTGIALFAKRTPRPFPPPFLSPPSASFSDPLSTHDRSRAYVGGQLIQGFTNGDDAVFASDYFICANDGVGAWSTRPRGHAGLWARLILHFWATAIFEDALRQGDGYQPDPVAYLQRAYEQTIEATSAPNDWQGTTTATGAQLHYRRIERKEQQEPSNQQASETAAQSEDSSAPTSTPPADSQSPSSPCDTSEVEPVLYVTNLGDSQVMVIRPSTREVIYKSAEQWHWFDCPRQLGTNSPDTPSECAVVDAVPIQEGDIVLAMSDGVIDNLWAHEIVAKVTESLAKWQRGEVSVDWAVGVRGLDRQPCEADLYEGAGVSEDDDWQVRRRRRRDDSGMWYVAQELMEAAKAIAVDPFAESPFMEHAIEEGLASGGGKLDDISVVAAICRRND